MHRPRSHTLLGDGRAPLQPVHSHWQTLGALSQAKPAPQVWPQSAGHWKLQVVVSQRRLGDGELPPQSAGHSHRLLDVLQMYGVMQLPPHGTGLPSGNGEFSTQ